MSTEFYRYTKTKAGGRGAPILTTSIVCGSGRVDSKTFVLDTGSLVTVAPLHYAIDLCDLDGLKEEDTGCISLTNQPVKGIPVEVQIIVPGFPPIPEIIFFRNITYGVLGQSKFLEVLGALFLNEPLDSGLGRFKLVPRGHFRPVKAFIHS